MCLDINIDYCSDGYIEFKVSRPSGQYKYPIHYPASWNSYSGIRIQLSQTRLERWLSSPSWNSRWTILLKKTCERLYKILHSILIHDTKHLRESNLWRRTFLLQCVLDTGVFWDSTFGLLQRPHYSNHLRANGAASKFFYGRELRVKMLPG